MWGMWRLELPDTSGWDMWGCSVSVDDSTWYVMVVVGSSATGWGGSAILTATDCCGGWTKTNRTPALPVQSPTEDGLAETVSSERVWQFVWWVVDWSVVLGQRFQLIILSIILCWGWLVWPAPARWGPAVARPAAQLQTLRLLLRPRHLYFLWETRTRHDTAWQARQCQGSLVICMADKLLIDPTAATAHVLSLQSGASGECPSCHILPCHSPHGTGTPTMPVAIPSPLYTFIYCISQLEEEKSHILIASERLSSIFSNKQEGK